MLRPNLLGDSAARGSAPATWTLNEQADHEAAQMREPVDELVHVVDRSVGGAVKPNLARTGEGRQTAPLGSKPRVCSSKEQRTFLAVNKFHYLTRRRPSDLQEGSVI
jgi:hypothetical protein